MAKYRSWKQELIARNNEKEITIMKLYDYLNNLSLTDMNATCTITTTKGWAYTGPINAIPYRLAKLDINPNETEWELPGEGSVYEVPTLEIIAR